MAMFQRTARTSRRSGDDKRIPTPVKILAFVFVAGIGYVAGALNGQLFGSGSSLLGNEKLDLSTLQTTYQAVKADYDGEINNAKLIEGANRGMVEALGDEYTVYMNKAESAEFNNNLSGNIGGGIGIELSVRNEQPTIVRVLRDNPAEKIGLLVDDIIVAVNGESVEGQTNNEIVSKIRGDVGTTVKVTVARGGATKDFTVTRAQVNNPSAYGEVKDGIGTLVVTRFDDETGSLARGVAQEFKAAGVKGVILDLRGNGGGFVTAAQDVAGIWLDEQVVVSERAGNKVVDELKSGGDPILNGVPTVVLINKSSASASEIVAGALRDHKVAKLIGDTSFGKGSVQKLVNLTDGATLKVTVARWYTPSGINISKTGIKPDIAIERTADDFNANRDPQLDSARTQF